MRLVIASIAVVVMATMPGSAQVELAPLSPRGTDEGAALFESLSPAESGVEFQMLLPDIATHPHELLHLSAYGGICVGDYDADGLTDFYVTSPLGGNRLFRNVGGFRFEDVTETSGVSSPELWGTGASFIDIDNDGDLDIYACAYRMPNRLFINERVGDAGNVRFTERAKEFGLDYSGGSMNMAFADIDNDGDLDGYLVTTAVPPPQGTGFRVEYEGRRPVIPEELREHWGLIYLPGDRVHRTEAGQYDHLFRNDGGRFTEVSKEAGIDGPFFTLAAIWWDFNEDGWPDLYVANDYLGADMLYLNNGDGTFRDVIRETIPHTPWSSMGMDIGDLNNNGRIDMMTTDMLGSTHYRRHVMLGETSKTGWFLDFAEPRQYARNAVYLNTGTTRMMEVANLAGLAATDWTWAPRIEDFDNDGLVDVLIVNGMLRDVQHADIGNYADRTFGGGSARWARFWSEQAMHSEPNVAYRNNGDLAFEEVGAEWGFDSKGMSMGIVTADFDNDGDLDVLVNNVDSPLSVLRNRSVSGNRLRVRLRGTESNKFGLGATVRVHSGQGVHTRHVTAARSWLSGGEPDLHFGLGETDSASRIEVVWPGGAIQRVDDVDANQIVTITEAGKSDVESQKPAPTFRVTDALRLAIHSETPFDDFQKQPLLPRRVSQDAFCMAATDLNDDGIDDFYLGGGEGQTGRFFFSDGAGGFELKGSAAFAPSRSSVDTAAVFLDADGDGDSDLFVSSGGSRASPGSDSYRDRLYLNDGNGVWRDASDRLPGLARNTSATVAFDADGDGDPDLFVGCAAVPGVYPQSEDSFLLINEDERFHVREDPVFGELGLVRSVDAADLDGDGSMELIVASEWGPVRILERETGRFEDVSKRAGTHDLNGLWRSVATGDFDRDGDVDFVAGNLGLNTSYRASASEPLELLHGTIPSAMPDQIIEVHREGGRRLPVRGFDELSRVVPLLRQRFQNFHFFAVASIEEILGTDVVEGMASLRAETLETTVFLNDGNGRFTATPLPRIAQASPVSDIAVTDLDGDGILDLVLAQNDFSYQRLIGRMDGGLGLVLRGAGDGTFLPIIAADSGIVVPGDSRRVIVGSINDDARADLIFGVRNAPVQVYLGSDD